MGKTAATLVEVQLPERQAHNSRMFVDLCENIHIHHREWRLVFSLPEFFEFASILRSAEVDARAYLAQNPDYEEGAYPTTLMIAGGEKRYLAHSPAPHRSHYFPHRFAVEVLERSQRDDVHVHWRDHRFVMPREHFRQIARAFRQAKEALDKFEAGGGHKPRKRRHLTEDELREKASSQGEPSGLSGVVELPVGKIVPRERPPRDPAWVEALRERYRKGEEVPPILVSTEKDGSHRVVDGNHRLTAAREEGLERIRCVVLPLSFDETNPLRSAETRCKIFDEETGGRFGTSDFLRDWLAWKLGTHWRSHFRDKAK